MGVIPRGSIRGELTDNFSAVKTKISKLQGGMWTSNITGAGVFETRHDGCPT